MAERLIPHHPIYIPSKGRYTKGRALTARLLLRDGVPFHMVVEEPERAAYEAIVGPDRVLVLPFTDQGLIAARNWIMDHAIEHGAERHWQLDDNMAAFFRMWGGKRVYCTSGAALTVAETFADRYENLARCGLNYEMFAIRAYTPVVVNAHVYSCTLVDNAIPQRWRARYNDDTDLCLQVLAGGWCTALISAFCVRKTKTMKLGGGNTDDLYRGDGRLKMARSLERMWPGVVETRRRWERPQHAIVGNWRRFDTPLRLKPGIDLSALPPVDDMGITLRAVRPVRSPRMKQLLADAKQPRPEPGLSGGGK
jgi:hypothetical protein